MDKFVLLSDEDKRAYFKVAAADLNLLPQLIEKDFWVCWILKTLFSLPVIGSHLTFKGGTSLSKCYNIIKRFSEDIDVSIERSILSSSDPIEPDKNESSNENNRRLKRLQQVCQSKINQAIIPELKDRISSILPDKKKWKIELDTNDASRQTVLFSFPHLFISDSHGYIKSAVRIEFGPRADHWPVENLPVNPYVARTSGSMNITGTSVRVLSAERTFWEKATILHMIYYTPQEKSVRARMSRHYYDLSAMADTHICDKALKRISLLKEVSEHKSLFFKINWAHYEKAKPGSLRLVPRDDQISQLKIDYQQMEQMFFESPPPFESILTKLQELEKRINGLKV